MSYELRKIMRALFRKGVVIVREGGGHTIIRSQNGRQTSVPRHKSVRRSTTRKIVKELGLKWEEVERDML